MFKPFGENIWTTHRPLRFTGVELGTCMTVIRLCNGNLFVHSPVILDQETRNQLDSFGKVKFVIAPNRLHHLYIGDYVTAYPDALIYAAPGLPKKRQDLKFYEVLSDDVPSSWVGEIDQLVFQGLPFLNEVVFFHRQSRTLLLTDLAFNIREDSPLLTRGLARLGGVYKKVGLPLDLNFLIQNRQAARRSIERILSWDFEQITICHGHLITNDGRELLRQAWQWI